MASPQRSCRPTGRLRSARAARAPAAALVSAAREVFERDGFLEARITDIAAAAGVAAGSFYTYFMSKEDVFAAVIDGDRARRCSTPVCGEFADRDDPVAVIEATNRSYLVAYRRNAKLMASDGAGRPDRRRLSPAASAPGPRLHRAQRATRSRGFSSAASPTPSSTRARRQALSAMVEPHGLLPIRPGPRQRITVDRSCQDAHPAVGGRSRNPALHAKEMTTMEFELTDRCKELRERLLAFMDEHVYPAEPVYHEQLARLRRSALPPAGHGGAQGAGRATPGCGTCSYPDTRTRARAEERRVRAAGRDHGPQPHRLGGVQLLGARHGQHGGPDPVRHARAAGPLAAAAARRARSARRSR